MAHQTVVKNTRTKEEAWFIGLAEGIIYNAFGEMKHHAGVSGDGGYEIKSKTETERALDKAIQDFKKMNYPDPNRMDEIIEFRNKMKNDKPTDEYIIWFL